MKKRIAIIAVGIVLVLAILIGKSAFQYNNKDNEVLIFQFGQVVDIKKEPGIYFKVPIFQNSKTIFVGEQLYDVSSTDVITSDKKSMISDCYVTWRITDSKKYYQTLSSESVAQSRIDVAVYNAMKNVISATSQEDVINGKDGSLGDSILKKIRNLGQYGIEITQVEVKVLDLPNDNKVAVYNRMISERNAIAAEYTANGKKEADTIKSKADSDARKIESDAKVKAADTIAEGENQYYNILAESYGKSPERREFYNFMIGLDAMKDSLSNGGTIVIDKESPLYGILNDN